jgi:glyoxylase-like metal-dependent hydrolase (beta-lactamase superfamily II)
MKLFSCIKGACISLAIIAAASSAGAAEQGIKRLYIFDCGQGHAEDMSRWAPGLNSGKPLDVSGSCYLIRHAKGDLIWDTGVPDSVAASPEGYGGKNGAPLWRRPKTLASQLTEIGVKPEEVQFIAVSHTHPDHVGNVELFPQSTLLVQKAEYDWPNPLGVPRFKAEHPVKKLEGDYDVFGDGSVTIISTPGHTPGHQSLLVKLPVTGALILSGDAVHFKDNWDNRRIPATNVDKDKTLASMQRMADLMAQFHAQLWINHDKPQSDQQKHSPAFYE